MSNPLKKYGVNRDLEQKGSEVTVDDMTFIVRSASASNRGYRFALAIAANRRREELQADSAKAFDIHESVMIEAFSDAVILGWRGVDGEDGQPLEFNRENCIKIMESCPEIWDAVHEAAIDTSRFRSYAQEDGEALGKSLSGTSSTEPT